MKKRFLFLYIVIISIILIISSITLYLDYKNEIKHVNEIVDTYINNRKSTIVSIYNYTNDKNKTLEIINDALRKSIKSDKTFEYVIAEIRGDSICFISEHNKLVKNRQIILPVNTDKALPMRLALKGGSGFVKGKDYTGEEVYAAYTFIPTLGWGLVVKIDTDEIWEDIYQTGVIILFLTVIFSLISTFLIYKFSVPIDKELKTSEEKYRMVFQNANDGIFIADKQGNYIDVNQNGCEMLGYSFEELTKMKIIQLISPSYIEKEAVRFDEVKSGNNLTTEREMVCKDGSIITVEISSNLLPDGNVLGVVRNVTERKQYELKLKTQNEEIQTQNEEIQQQNEEYKQINEEYKQINDELKLAKERAEESEKRVRSTLDNMLEGCQIIDFDWRYLYLNDAADKHNRRPKEELLGNKYMDMWPGIEATDVFKVIKCCLEDRIPRHMENEFVFPNEARGWFDISIQPVPEGVFILSIDITERKLAEKQLKQKSEEIETQNEEYKQINEEYKQINEELYIAKIKAEESDKLKSAFLANMSHEIRTPMNGIVGFADLLNNPGLSDHKRKEFTSIIIERSNQLLNIVNDILDISKIEAGLVSVKNETVAINKLITELWSFYSNHEKLKDIHFDKKLGLNGLQKYILADKTKITQILNNLLNNALKFTSQGHIIFGYELKNEMLEFFVEDTGIGIQDEYKEKIFERFRQVEHELTKNYGGTGLGLSISKELVEMMGGKIWIESKLGYGTKIFFTIPYVPLSTENEKAARLINSRSYKNIEGKSIMIVDDDEINLLYLKELISEFRLKVFEATNGIEAVEKFKENREISLVLMDIKMPIMDGIEATKLIKSMNSATKIVAQTAYAMYSEKEMAIKEGCDDYISKPLNKEILIDLIKKYL